MAGKNLDNYDLAADVERPGTSYASAMFYASKKLRLRKQISQHMFFTSSSFRVEKVEKNIKY